MGYNRPYVLKGPTMSTKTSTTKMIVLTTVFVLTALYLPVIALIWAGVVIWKHKQK
jgi:hypothetical protein